MTRTKAEEAAAAKGHIGTWSTPEERAADREKKDQRRRNRQHERLLNARRELRDVARLTADLKLRDLIDGAMPALDEAYERAEAIAFGDLNELDEHYAYQKEAYERICKMNDD